MIGALDAPDGMPFGSSYTFGPDGRMYAIAGEATAPTATDAASILIYHVDRPTAQPQVSGPAGIVGTWTRTQSRADELAAFAAAGLLDKAQEWVTANWVSPTPTVADGNFCKGAAASRAHSHFFTADGLFAR